MTLRKAIESCFQPKELDAIKKSRCMSPPTLLKEAGLRCFLHKQPEEVESQIRAGLIILERLGYMPKMD